MGAFVLALVAAGIFAVGSVLQQRAARSSARLVLPRQRHRARRMASLLIGSPTWLGGAGLAGIGFGFHAAALHAGALAVVQPVQMLTLPASLLIGGARQHRLGRWDWAGIGGLCLGVAVFLAVAAPHDGPPRPRALLFLATIAAAGIIAGLWLVGRNAPPAARGLLVGSAAALGFGLTAALTKAATTDLAGGGVPGMLENWPGYALVAVGLAALGLEQAAFSGAPLATVMLPVTLLNPIAATALGLVAWHEHLSRGPSAVLAATLAGLALAAGGVLALARSPLLRPRPSRVR